MVHSSFGKCSHHLCRKTDKLYSCKYCKKKFCRKCVEPGLAGIPDFKSNQEYAKEFLKEHDREDGHPCLPYTHFVYKKLEEEKKEKDRNFESFLDWLKKNPEKKIDVSYQGREDGVKIRTPRKEALSYLDSKIRRFEEKEDEEEHKEQRRENKKEEREKLSGWTKFFIIILILFAMWFFFFYDGKESSSDEFESKEMAKSVLLEVNRARQNKSLYALSYDENAYQLAVNISKKFNDSNSYFVSDSDLSEISVFYNIEKPVLLSKKLEGLNKSDFDLMATEWTTRKIFTEKTLSKNFSSGAVGCYDITCVLVLHNKKVEEKVSVSSFDSPSVNEPDSISGSPLGPSIDISSLETEIHNLINEERSNYGLRALSFDNKLSDIAREHSRDMAVNNFFEHYNLEGQDPTDRANSAGYRCYKDYGSYYTEGIAENIFQNNLYDSVSYGVAIVVPYYIHDWNTQQEIAESTVSGWMGSPGHRQNILDFSYDKEGIGVAISSDDKVYITQDFC